jgi:hypothetical protein
MMSRTVNSDLDTEKILSSGSILRCSQGVQIIHTTRSHRYPQFNENKQQDEKVCRFLPVVILAAGFFVASHPSQSLAQNQVQMERMMLQNEIKSLEDQRFKSPSKQHTQFFDVKIAQKNAYLQELNSNPDQNLYDYEKQDRQSRPKTVINPWSGRAYQVVR